VTMTSGMPNGDLSLIETTNLNCPHPDTQQPCGTGLRTKAQHGLVSTTYAAVKCSLLGFEIVAKYECARVPSGAPGL